MKRRVIILLAGVASLAWAAEAAAQPQPQPPQQRPAGVGQPAPGREHRADHPGQASGAHPPPPGQAGGQPRFDRTPRMPPSAAVSSPGAPPQVQHRPGDFAHRAPNLPPAGGPPQTVHPPGAGPHPAPQTIRPPGVAPPQAPGVRRPSGVPQLGDWNRALRGVDRDAAARAWREGHRDWDRQSPWRRDRDWWRGSAAFRLFLGPRLGFFFIPELGYVSAPPEFEHRAWRAGERLPRWFWRYVVEDYWTYGLPAPPYGCAWVWVGHDVALIELDDGYILDLVRNVW